jgi:hypothetical protein
MTSGKCRHGGFKAPYEHHTERGTFSLFVRNDHGAKRHLAMNSFRAAFKINSIRYSPV